MTLHPPPRRHLTGEPLRRGAFLPLGAFPLPAWIPRTRRMAPMATMSTSGPSNPPLASQPHPTLSLRGACSTVANTASDLPLSRPGHPGIWGSSRVAAPMETAIRPRNTNRGGVPSRKPNRGTRSSEAGPRMKGGKEGSEVALPWDSGVGRSSLTWTSCPPSRGEPTSGHASPPYSRVCQRGRGESHQTIRSSVPSPRMVL